MKDRWVGSIYLEDEASIFYVNKLLTYWPYTFFCYVIDKLVSYTIKPSRFFLYQIQIVNILMDPIM
jgi:hypothetical protein